MGITRAFLTLPAALVLATPSFAQESPLTLNPASAWQVDYGEESCALRRSFGSDGAGVDLEILQEAPGPYFQVTVTAHSIALTGSDARARFEPDNRAQVPQYVRASAVGDVAVLTFTDSVQRNVAGDSRPYIGWTDQRRNERERSITALAIEDAFARDLVLQTGEMHAPMEALRTCILDLYGSWGVDLEAHRALWQPVRNQSAGQLIPLLVRMVSQKLRSRPSVPPVIRVVVGADGRLTRCRVHFTEADEELSRQMCDTVARVSRYEPAQISGRKRIVSYDTIVLPIALAR